MKLIEGQLIHRRYRLDSRLAQGGMGEVWKGYDIQLGREVAIKALRSDMTNAEAKLRRLRAEAHNSANLAHPNIAALFEYYEHDGIGFLIMEYVPSKSLADLFHSKGAMDPIELLPILIQTARGLFVAHSHGVIHRDVKPANIMVSDTGEVKITDFGVSYSTGQGQITQDGMVVGTAQYISPEQAQGPAGHAAIGHLFTGRSGVRGPCRASSVHRHHSGRYRRSAREPIPCLRCRTRWTSSYANLSCQCWPRTRWIARKTRWWCPVRWHASNAVCWISRPKWPTPPWPRPAIDCRASDQHATHCFGGPRPSRLGGNKQ